MTITKREAVRRAIEAGHDKPTAGVKWIKEQFNLTLSQAMFSFNKHVWSKRGELKAVQGGVDPPSRPTELARQLKMLIRSYGIQEVRDMIDILEG